MIEQFIEISFQHEGIHSWPDAVKYPGVEFLSSPHRHIFHFYAKMQTWHWDREVEFILFKRELENLYKDGTLEHQYMSCEMLANQLLQHIQSKYGTTRKLIIRVYEDDENGAVLEYTPDPSRKDSNVFMPSPPNGWELKYDRLDHQNESVH